METDDKVKSDEGTTGTHTACPSGLHCYNALNLYAGIGGNRALWPDNINVTAVEADAAIADVYHNRFPNDIMIVGDAHAYLRDHYHRFDFIWSSPPCPTHGQYRYNVGVRAKGYKCLYPDMSLYEEILFLQYHAKCKWVVENTISYYAPFVPPQQIQRHYFWANFIIPNIELPAADIRSKNKISDYDFDVSLGNIPNKRQVLRNCVDPILGKHVLAQALQSNKWKIESGEGYEKTLFYYGKQRNKNITDER